MEAINPFLLALSFDWTLDYLIKWIFDRAGFHCLNQTDLDLIVQSDSELIYSFLHFYPQTNLIILSC